MSIELRPLGVACNLGCRYCYQNPQREAGNLRGRYNLNKMKAAALRHGKPFTLFGGEPLLMDFADLEDLLAWGHARFGRSSIQTNGVLIEDRHIDLFRRYEVDVGLSIDGPGELNDVRWKHSQVETREATEKVEQAIARLCARYKPPGIIVTLHRGNATPQKRPRLFAWIRQLAEMGIRSLRLHLLEVDSPLVRAQWALSPAENVDMLLDFIRFQEELPMLSFDLIREIEELLQGRDQKASCIWRACDPYTTEAVQGVEGNGQSSNCGRTNKDGVDFVKAGQEGYERYVTLYHTAQNEGGCKGCRFFLMCKGQCPGTAIDGDWRNRTEHCSTWKGVFDAIERKLIQRGGIPLTIHPIRFRLEGVMIEAWGKGHNPSLGWMLARIQSRGARLSNPGSGSRVGAKPFLRLSWVSEAAERLWMPRMEAVRSMLEDLCIHAAANPGAGCQLRIVRRHRLHSLFVLAAQRGVAAATLPHPPAGRNEALVPRQPNQQLQILLIGNTGKLETARRAWTSQQWDAFSRLLDLPSLQQREFAQHLQEESAGTHPHPTRGLPDSPHPEDHQLLHLIGLSWWPTPLHCSSDLETLRWLGDRQQLANEQFPDELQWLQEFLAMPMEWSALHGIAELKTPLFRCMHDTISTAEKHRFLFRGHHLPAESARGLGHPYQLARRRLPAVPV